MLYKIAHFLRDHMPWLWDLLDMVNSMLFRIRYGNNLKHVENEICQRGNIESLCSDGYDIMPIRDIKTEDLVEFFACQPYEAYRFFKPNGFEKNDPAGIAESVWYRAR